MLRTSIHLPETLHQRLILASQRKGQSFSEVIRDLLDKGLATQEKKHLETLYKGLHKLHGAGPTGIKDASATINQRLYSQTGAPQE